MGELIRWFEKRKETKALATIQRHLALATDLVGHLEKALHAAVEGDEKEMRQAIGRVTSGEKEADALRRRVMDDVSKGELPPVDRVDLMDLVKRVDMVADWSRESTRILGAIPMEHVPETIKNGLVEMVSNVKECAESLLRCVNKMIAKPDEALRAADDVERKEERVDDLHEKTRILLVKEDLLKAGVVVLISQLFDALEMIADACEDACDQVRIIMVRK